MKTIIELMNLDGRVALITGGTGHIGLAAAQVLIELGAKVAIVDQSFQECQERSDALGTAAYPFPCDLTDEMAIRELVQQVITKCQKLDILIHCAAYVGTTAVPGWAVPFEEQSVSAWDAAMRVNLTAAFILAQAARAALSASGHGAMILISSTYGVVGPDWSLYSGTGMAHPIGYSASKGGLLQLTRALATTLAPDIRVNAISPGGVWRNQPKDFRERYEARTPLKRMAVEEDVKGAVAYLASDLSAYVTGHNLVVDGGWTAW
jgi:NAD(P)-dependent dehydrogenase (short-subunit alcohol dehydrogenase family)